MSGGHFDHKNYCLTDIADSIEGYVKRVVDQKKDEYGCCPEILQPESIEILQGIIKKCRKLERELHVVDYYISGDYGEDDILALRKNKRAKQ